MTTSDIQFLNDARSQVARQIDRYFAGDVTADAVGQVGYAGGQIAYITSVKLDVVRALTSGDSLNAARTRTDQQGI